MRRTNDPEKLLALKIAAAHEHTSVSDLVREAIDLMLEKRKSSMDTASARNTKLKDVLERNDALNETTNVAEEAIECDVLDAAR